MKFRKMLIAATACLAVLAAGSAPSHAQFGQHPAYLHALSDLRLERAYLDHQTPNERIDDESQHAIDEIDAAMHEIKSISDDGRDLHDHAPIDFRLPPFERFQRARQAGDAALNNVNSEGENFLTRGFKHRALDHIDKANHIVDHILMRFQNGPGDGDRPHGDRPYGGEPHGDRPYDGPGHEGHPAYLHALGDLRLMRAYLDRMTPNDRVDEESARAIAEIDAAIREIKQASIDDGRDIRDHAPFDFHMPPPDRFHRAFDAGNAAWNEINREEDNGYARGLKQRALDHIDRANHIVGHILHRFDDMHRFDGDRR